MPSTLSTHPDGTMTVSFTFRPGSSMLESETNLQRAANEALNAATGACLSRFDTDGTPLLIGRAKLTSKGRLSKLYQTPYGEVSVERHVYQSSKGGRTFCPMEQDARVFRTATPLLARQVASKYVHGDSRIAVKDFAGHGRIITHGYVREVASDVALVAMEKEEAWTPAPPPIPAGTKVKTVSVGVDGTCALMDKNEGWRQVMVGTLALYDEAGERLHTTYVAAAPEYGKKTFFERMDRELALLKEAFPGARYAGVADGAADHWPWLEENTTWQTIDFWHAAEYLNAAAAGMAGSAAAQRQWADGACHRLKHETDGAGQLLAEMSQRLAGGRHTAAVREALEKAVTYFTNHLERMKYAFNQAMGLPLGSGVTEAACKCVAKARLCGSGMRWDGKGAAEVLRLRTMLKTEGRWEEFWGKVSRHGFARITAPKRRKKIKDITHG